MTGSSEDNGEPTEPSTDRDLTMPNIIRGKAYVVGDNIDTDQIIPAQYLSLVPTIEEEYKKLGGYALCGLPADQYPKRFVQPEQAPSEYSIIIAGRNFGCGSSREHAPIALGAAGIRIVIAESFARIFFRNSIATGEFYPVESASCLRTEIETGEEVAVDLDRLTASREGSAVAHELRPLGDVKNIVAAGGLFAYARQTGLVKEGSAAQ